MRRAALALLLLLLASPARADDEAKPQIAWFHRIADARKAAQETGRPLFIATHVRPRVASPETTQRFAAWAALYRESTIVELSRQFACVLRVVQAPEGKDPDAEGGPGAVHLVVDQTSRQLARLDASTPKEGPAGIKQLGSILRGGLRNFGEIDADAPLIDAARVAKAGLRLDGISPSKPVTVPHGVPGVRLRLKWELPAPALKGDKNTRILAAVQMRWDEEGPFRIGEVAFGAGEEVDRPIDVRFDEIEGLAKLATRGTHRVDLYLDPLPGSYPFSKGPLHVGTVWIELGDGGGGGGGSSDDQQQPEEQPQPPPPKPDEGKEEEQPLPPPEREEVVDPFVGEGDTVKKDDAVVAVEDPDGGVKPPKQVPIEEALREFEKMKEREIAREGISARDRELLKRYFEILRRNARKGGAKKGAK